MEKWCHVGPIPCDTEKVERFLLVQKLYESTSIPEKRMIFEKSHIGIQGEETG